MSEAAPCQCVKCLRYLAHDRQDSQNHCIECVGAYNKDITDFDRMEVGIPLAQIHDTLLAPRDLELLALLTEECGEVAQRVGKIIRWGWNADFKGTTQQHKLEVELADVFAAVFLMAQNDLINEDRVRELMLEKLKKFDEDAAGPRQRLLHAKMRRESKA